MYGRRKVSLDDADIKRISDLLKPEESRQANARYTSEATAETARRVAVEVSNNLSAQIAQVHEGLAVNNTKLDDIQNTMDVRHEEIRVIQQKLLEHEAHVLEMKSRRIIDKVIDHEAIKNRSMGALKIAGVAAPFGAALILAKVKHYFGW